MSTSEIIIKTLFREISVHVGQDDLPTAKRLLDRATREHGHKPQVEWFLAKVYRNLGLEPPEPGPGANWPDVPSDDDLAFLAEQEAIHREEEFIIEAPPSEPPGRKRLSLRPDRGDNGAPADGPKIVYRSRATKSAFESSKDLSESPAESSPEPPTETSPRQSTATTGEIQADTGNTQIQASPDREPAPQPGKGDTTDPAAASPAPPSSPIEPAKPAHRPTAPETRTPLPQASPDEDEDGEEEPPEGEDWEQGTLFLEDDDLSGADLDDEQAVDDPISPSAVDTNKEFSFDDLLALDEWDDSAEEEDAQEEDLDALGLEERLTLEDRARQIAIDFLLENDLEHSWLDFLTEIFTKRSWGAVRNAMQWAVERDISLEQLMLARALRAVWHEREDYWINFNYAWARTECAEATHKHLSWRFAIRLVAAFESVPSIEEVESTLEQEYEFWLNHSTLRRAYPAFLRYLTSYRFSTSPRLLPANFGWHFEAKDWSEPTAYALEPGCAYHIEHQLAELGVDLTSKNPCKSYAFSDIPMDTLLARFEKPEKDGEKPVSGKNAKPNKKKQTVRRTPDFLLEETTS